MERILVGLDGSGREESVLAAAVDLARRTGGKLWLYRAVTVPHELPPVAMTMSPSDLAPVLVGLGEEALRKRGAEVPPELLGGIESALAVPWQGICEAAHRLRADVIVIGSHGYGGLDRLLGTTAAKVVNHAEHSVLVVKKG
jgi:nucleotide-binding universal stress UspA family protein